MLEFLNNLHISFKNVAKVLDTEGINFNYQNVHGYTMLHNAARWGKTDVVKLLIQKGALVNICNNYGESPLADACEHGHYATAELLIENGAKNNLKRFITSEDHYENTPLHAACRNNYLRIIRLLIREVEVLNNIKNSVGCTPLHYASMKGSVDAVKILLNHGEDVNIISGEGWSSMHYACRWNNIEVVKILLSNEAYYNSKNIDGHTPMRIARIYRSFDVVEYLEKDFKKKIYICSLIINPEVLKYYIVSKMHDMT